MYFVFTQENVTKVRCNQEFIRFGYEEYLLRSAILFSWVNHAKSILRANSG